MAELVTRIGACELPVGPLDEVRGHWVTCSCADYSEAISAAGGPGRLHVWSSLTDLAGQFGRPFVFTCWGTEELPVAASGGAPFERTPCDQDHAVFVEGAD